MELHARTRTLLRRAGLASALAALLVPAAAGTASAKPKAKKAPVITSISPRSLAVGETLTVRGRHFIRGRDKNTVVFKRTGAAAVFVKADVGTTKLLKVKLPARLEKVLFVRNGETVPTRLQLRVLAARFGTSFSTGVRVPLVGPPRPPIPESPVADPNADCDGDGQINAVDTDDDNDLVLDTTEKTLKTDPCKYDSDGDGISDGYEYQSALDLNNSRYRGTLTPLPAPWKKPYPNPLFADSGVDYDGDSLTLSEEFELWKTFRDPAKGLTDLVYSDGNQYSAYHVDPTTRKPGALIGPDPVAKYTNFIAWAQSAGVWNISIPFRPGTLAAVPNNATTLANVTLNDFNQDGDNTQPGEAAWWDADGNGRLSDDERDEDGDGLSNYDEYHGQAQPGFWSSCYAFENAYPVAFEATSPNDADSDGDGILDGADDQDQDDIPNLMELSRSAATQTVGDGNCKKPAIPTTAPAGRPANGFVNPFNPCLPYTNSRTCTRHPGFTGTPAPFSLEAKDIYWILN
jgi:hypothetical protein